jgi:hypothetical protein
MLHLLKLRFKLYTLSCQTDIEDIHAGCKGANTPETFSTENLQVIPAFEFKKGLSVQERE